MTSRAFRTVAVSGWFDPLHPGHVDYLASARLLGDKLVVILNSEVTRPQGCRMCDADRKTMLHSLRHVDDVVLCQDSDASVCRTLERLRPSVFAKGETASSEEQRVCEENGIELVTGVGTSLHLHALLLSFP